MKRIHTTRVHKKRVGNDHFLGPKSLGVCVPTRETSKGTNQLAAETTGEDDQKAERERAAWSDSDAAPGPYVISIRLL